VDDAAAQVSSGTLDDPVEKVGRRERDQDDDRDPKGDGRHGQIGRDDRADEVDDHGVEEVDRNGVEAISAGY